MKLARSTTFATLVVALAATAVSADDEKKEPNACVSLNVHPDGRCAHDPVDTVTFPTYTKPGRSGCYGDEDDDMIIAVADQYCNLKTGNYHQVVYPKGIDCEEDEIPWYLRLFFPTEQVFAPDNCVSGGWSAGFSLNFCQKGPCPDDDDDDDFDDDDDDEDDDDGPPSEEASSSSSFSSSSSSSSEDGAEYAEKVLKEEINAHEAPLRGLRGE